MGFTEARSAIDKDRIIFLPRHTSGGLGGSMRQVVAGADDKIIESITWIEASFAIPRSGPASNRNGRLIDLYHSLVMNNLFIIHDIFNGRFGESVIY